MDATDFPRGMLLLAQFRNCIDPTPIFEPLKGIVLIIGCPVCPKDSRRSEMFRTTCVLVTLPPGIVAKRFELSKGFQPKGLLKGTEVVTLMGGATVGPNVVMIGVDPEGIGKLLTVVMSVGLRLGIC